MKFIQGNSRQQIQMLSLDDFISPENPVRFIDAFVHKMELEKLDARANFLSTKNCCKKNDSF